jgi:hypothetical protein
MPSRRIYITLNSDKEKDRIIEKYLSNSYSEPDAIKEAIYRLATNSTQKVQKDYNSTDKEQLVTKSNNKVLKGANNTKKVEKVTVTKSTEKVQNNTDNLDVTVKQINKNELEELKKFM